MKCPGQDTMYWNDQAIYNARCPECDQPVEFFKDDTTRKCPGCGHRFLNPKMDFGCAAYCQHAEQCIGNLPPELLAQQDNLLKDRMAVEVKRYFHTDFKRIGHAADVARFAEEIGKQEKGSELSIILVAAYLHDVGFVEAEKKYPGEADKYHEVEGIPIATMLLDKVGASDELKESVCSIIDHHHHPAGNESVNFKVLFDADLIVNMKDELKINSDFKDKIKEIITTKFFTDSGKDIAERLFLN